MQALIALVTIITLAICIAAPDNVNCIAELKRQTSFNKQFLCGPPQPRAIPLEGLENLMKPPNGCMTIWPQTVVLHRCNCGASFCERNKESEAGFCEDMEKSCQPIASKNVSLTFKKTMHKSDPCEITKTKITFFHVTAVNHTECGCQ